MLLQMFTTACTLMSPCVRSPLMMAETSFTDSPSWPTVQRLLDESLPVFSLAVYYKQLLAIGGAEERAADGQNLWI